MRDRLSFYYLGSVILLALVIGGGVSQFLLTDHLIQIALIPAVFIGFGGLFNPQISTFVRLFTLLSMLVVGLQFIPIDSDNWPSQNIISLTQLQLFSPVPGKSVESSLFFIVLLGFCLHVMQLKPETQARLLNFVFIGVTINIILVLFQLSYPNGFGTYGVLPYAISVGIFQNENHLSALFVAIIPMLAVRLIGVSNRGYLCYPILLVLVVVLYAVGSRAGVFMATVAAIFSVFWFKVGHRLIGKRIFWLIAVSPVLVVLMWKIGGFDIYFLDDRWLMTQNTWAALKDHWLLGSGLGSFETIYPLYERVDQIELKYTHHAHNDVLELLLETGLPGLVLLIAMLVIILRNFDRSLSTQACIFAIFTIILHSVLDYPLRTMAVGIIFSYFLAIALAKKHKRVRVRVKAAKPFWVSEK
ncbi:MAG: O-antigen ligase family protein [Rhizobiaceae bacterium]